MSKYLALSIVLVRNPACSQKIYVVKKNWKGKYWCKEYESEFSTLEAPEVLVLYLLPYQLGLTIVMVSICNLAG